MLFSVVDWHLVALLLIHVPNAIWWRSNWTDGFCKNTYIIEWKRWVRTAPRIAIFVSTLLKQATSCDAHTLINKRLVMIYRVDFMWVIRRILTFTVFWALCQTVIPIYLNILMHSINLLAILNLRREILFISLFCLYFKILTENLIISFT